ncbi:transposase [Serratia marcescens]|uniref:DNA-binding protein n=1 Tax=Serratia marcescens TaxID=615 RepID=UPI000F7DB14A|nr:DNA-binding protein [Serratia marcescens]RTF83065.1 transposase [Serratia marcescens]RTF95172.1 transposase [Serratia marcescens]RTF99441.1 transposase [Serratia marcescens]
MEKKWFSARELMGKAGLPSTPQGVNLMARREGWVSRRRSGVQGKALEYHIDSLPFGARSLSALRETDHPDYDVKRQDPIRVWIEYYYHLTESEREKMVAFLMREGIGGLLARIDEESNT